MMEHIYTIGPFVFFATIMVFGGQWMKKNPEGKNKYLYALGIAAALGNAFAAMRMLFATELPAADRMSHAFLPMVVSILIITLIHKIPTKDG